MLTYGTRTETFREITLATPPPAGEDGQHPGGSGSGRRRPGVEPRHRAAQTGDDATRPPGRRPSPRPRSTPDCRPLRSPPTTPADFTGAFAQDGALDKVSIFNLLLTPGIWDPPVVSEALAFAERKRAFVIVDPPARRRGRPDRSAAADDRRHHDGRRRRPDHPEEPERRALLPVPAARTDPATGDTDGRRPVRLRRRASSPARTPTAASGRRRPATRPSSTTRPASSPSGRMTDPRQGTLNPLGVNCLRGFPGIGTVVFGARTLVAANPSFQQYRYVPVRRMALFLEQSLVQPASAGWSSSPTTCRSGWPSAPPSTTSCSACSTRARSRAQRRARRSRSAATPRPRRRTTRRTAS